MDSLQKEKDFFHSIAPALFDLVSGKNQQIRVVENKGVRDFATNVDLAAERLIVDEIKKRFPGDSI